MNRRNLLLGLGLSSLAASLPARSGAAQEETGDTAEFLFVQNAERASLAGGTLRLSGVDRATLYFSDRPERIVGHLPTESFVGRWSSGADSFESDPPNAAFSVAGREDPEVVVVVLTNPRLEGADLVYQAEVLEGDATLSGGPGILFIDSIGRPLTPNSVAGVHRRRRRRRHAIVN